MREKIREYHIDFYDYKFAQRREKAIYEQETEIWLALFEKCEERHHTSTDRLRLCRRFLDAYKERLAYQKSDFSSYRLPTLTPTLPDLGPTPTPPQVKDEALIKEMQKKYPLL